MTATASWPGPDRRGAGDRSGRLLLEAVALVQRALTASVADGAAPQARGAPAPLDGAKVRCEAAMLLRAATPLSARVPGLATALARLADSLAEGDTDELAVRLCLHPGVALDLALVPLHLRELGRGSRRLEPLLDDLFGTERLHGPERPANRELEQVWLHGLWSGDVEPGGVARALAASSLAWEFDHLAGTTDDAYAFTHAILYASDNGRRQVALPRPVEEIEADAEGILAVALEAGNHDVAAEVLWTWPMLARPVTPLACAASAFLAAVSDANGFLPGPGFDAAVFDDLALPERDLYVLRTSYHTTLAHGLCLAATLDPGGPTEPRQDPGTSRWRPAATTVTALVQQGPRAAAWWTWFARQSTSRQEQLVPALVAMALRRAATSADLAAIQQTLELVSACALPDAPIVRQAHALLRRAMTYAGRELVAAMH